MLLNHCGIDVKVTLVRRVDFLMIKFRIRSLFLAAEFDLNFILSDEKPHLFFNQFIVESFRGLNSIWFDATNVMRFLQKKT